MTQKDINQILADIEDSVLKAEACYQVWLTLRNCKNEGLDDVVNKDEHRDFFDITIRAVYSEMFINLSKVFDQTNSSGIRALKEELRAMHHNQMVTEIESKLGNHTSVVKALKGIRNQSLAHRDRNRTVGETYDQHGIKPREIFDLISVTKEIVKTASDCIHRDSQLLQSQRYRDSTINVLHDLKKGLTPHCSPH